MLCVVKKMLKKQKQNDLPVGNGRKKKRKVAVNNTKALRMIQMVLVTGRTLFWEMLQEREEVYRRIRGRIKFIIPHI